MRSPQISSPIEGFDPDNQPRPKFVANLIFRDYYTSPDVIVDKKFPGMQEISTDQSDPILECSYICPDNYLIQHSNQ